MKEEIKSGIYGALVSTGIILWLILAWWLATDTHYPIDWLLVLAGIILVAPMAFVVGIAVHLDHQDYKKYSGYH